MGHFLENSGMLWMVNDATSDAIVWHYTKARLIYQLFAKYRSADLFYVIEKLVMLIAIISRNDRNLKSWLLHIEQLDCCPVLWVTSCDRFQ